MSVYRYRVAEVEGIWWGRLIEGVDLMVFRGNSRLISG